MGNDLSAQLVGFVESVTAAMGLEAKVTVEPLDDGTRIVIAGGGCEVFLRRRAAALDAMQHLVNAAFRRQHPGRHIVVDCLDYRKGKDAELRETARLLVDRARETGEPQEIGPLNPYARRIVHLAVAELPGASSESVGDAFTKTVVITAGAPAT